VEGIHFDLAYTPIQHLGYKAVAVNVSDIAAMNGIAEQITVSIALSNRFSVEAVDALYAGIKSPVKTTKWILSEATLLFDIGIGHFHFSSWKSKEGKHYLSRWSESE
jgi:hypothetical protein